MIVGNEFFIKRLGGERLLKELKEDSSEKFREFPM